MKIGIRTFGVTILAIAIIITIAVIIKNNSKKEVLSLINQPLEGEIIYGNPDAPESIILYFNYNCTFCRKFFKEGYPALKKNYIDTNKLNLVVRLICPNSDKSALKAYQTALCINRFGDYTKLHKLLMHNNKIMYTEHFNQLIDDYISLNVDIAECIIENNDFRAIRINNQQLHELKTNGTPTFVFNNKVQSGFSDYNSLEKLLIE